MTDLGLRAKSKQALTTGFGLNKLLPLHLRQMHVALFSQCDMHGEGLSEVVACLSHLCMLKVSTQDRSVVRMRTVFYYEMRTLYRTLATQVGNALLRDDHVHVVFRVVLMAHHRHYAAYQATLCR